MKVERIKLAGDFVTLEPLGKSHIPDLRRFCFDERIWRWYPFEIKTLEDLETYIGDAERKFQAGSELAFATIDNKERVAVGSTRFMNIDTRNRRVEIGSTWIAPAYQRTYVNSEAKLLMLGHAFEVWGCLRVEFKTDVLNKKSRKAILRLGAKEEGIHRQQILTDAGRLRDSVYYSLLNTEWPGVKSRLMRSLETQ